MRLSPQVLNWRAVALKTQFSTKIRTSPDKGRPRHNERFRAEGLTGRVGNASAGSSSAQRIVTTDFERALGSFAVRHVAVCLQTFHVGCGLVEVACEASLTIAAAAVCAFAAKTDEAQLPMYQPNRSFREPQSLIDAEALFCEGG
jgi:hypothetical protein